MSARITTGMVQRNVLASINDVNARLAKTQSQVASGKQITRPSDDPFGASQAMALRHAIASTQQYQRNVHDAQGWQEASEQALGQVTDSVQRARELLVQGGSDSADPTARESIATEIDQLIDSIKQSGNSTYRGSYLFSGSQTQTPPYAQGSADDAYKGDTGGGSGSTTPGVVRQIGPGVTMTINLVGQEFLGDGQGSGDGKLLDTLRTAAADLRSGNGAALRGADLKGLDANLDTLLQVRADNGAKQNRLDSALARLSQVEEAQTTQLSDTEDTDYTKSLIDFNSQTAAYQAALKAGSSIIQSSLMDFLH